MASINEEITKLSQLTMLASFYRTHRALTSEQLEQKKSLESITVLDFENVTTKTLSAQDRHRFIALLIPVIQNAKHLNEYYLGNNTFSTKEIDALIAAFKEVRHIETLDLNHFKFSSIRQVNQLLANLSTHPSLKEINLENAIPEAALKKLISEVEKFQLNDHRKILPDDAAAFIALVYFYQEEKKGLILDERTMQAIEHIHNLEEARLLEAAKLNDVSADESLTPDASGIARNRNNYSEEPSEEPWEAFSIAMDDDSAMTHWNDQDISLSTHWSMPSSAPPISEHITTLEELERLSNLAELYNSPLASKEQNDTIKKALRKTGRLDVSNLTENLNPHERIEAARLISGILGSDPFIQDVNLENNNFSADELEIILLAIVTDEENTPTVHLENAISRDSIETVADDLQKLSDKLGEKLHLDKKTLTALDQVTPGKMTEHILFKSTNPKKSSHKTQNADNASAAKKIR